MLNLYLPLCCILLHNHKNYGNFVKNVNNEHEKNLSKRTSFKSIEQIITCLRRSVNDKNAFKFKGRLSNAKHCSKFNFQDQFLQAPSGDEQSLAQIAACIQRWPSDRRFWNLQGWYSLAESDWQLAETSFESSMRRSGHLTSALQEPRFGLEVMRALQGGDNWPTYLNENPDAVTNLPRFLSPLRDPRFQDLLEAQ